VSALEAQNPEFKPQSHQDKKKKKSVFSSSNLHKIKCTLFSGLLPQLRYRQIVSLSPTIFPRIPLEPISSPSPAPGKHCSLLRVLSFSKYHVMGILEYKDSFSLA
jgi:hypothetical protein